LMNIIILIKNKSKILVKIKQLKKIDQKNYPSEKN
jgi:hypothetical protein